MVVRPVAGSAGAGAVSDAGRGDVLTRFPLTAALSAAYFAGAWRSGARLATSDKAADMTNRSFVEATRKEDQANLLPQSEAA